MTWRANLRTGHHKPVLLFAMALGRLERCWTLDPQDPCEGLLVSSLRERQPSPWMFFLWSEYATCIRQDRSCQDTSFVPCGQIACHGEYNMEEFFAPLANITEFKFLFQERILLGSNMCPLTCQVCGPYKNERQVNPMVATILHGPCEHGWSYADGACFKYSYGGEDGASAPVVDWFTAERACQSEGAHLATVATEGQKHLVFNLVGQHPAHLGSYGLWAWIGLSTGTMGCSSDSSNWTWISTQQSKISPSMQHSFFPARCVDGTPHGMHTNRMDHMQRDAGTLQTFDFSSLNADSKRRAWLCSKPALFHTVEKGLCQDFGLLPIYDLEACQAAAKALLRMDMTALKYAKEMRPRACHVARSTHGPRISTHPTARDVGRNHSVTLLCQRANGTGQTAIDPAPRTDVGPVAGVSAANVSPSFRPAILATLLVVGLLPVILALALRWQALVALGRCAMDLFSSLRACLHKQAASKTEHLLLAVTLHRRRRSIANIAAASLAMFHLFELVRTCFMEEAVCESGSAFPQLRLVLALIHAGSIWLACLFLAVPHRMGWKSSRPDLCFLAFIIALDIARSALVGEQVLLVESRLYSQLLWRLLLGACCLPAAALVGNILYTTGLCTLYKVVIPDGMIFTVGTTRAGLLHNQGCNQLWTPLEAESSKQILHDFSVMGKSYGSSVHWTSLQNILEELLAKQTSFIEFVVSEVFLIAVVMVFLVLLDTLMSQEILKSLRLQSSEEQLLAVSQIFDRLCDATCLLSRDFHICNNSPKLQMILTMSGTLPMEGKDFRTFIASQEDRAIFEEFIDHCLREGFGDAVYLDLKGASGMRVRMQVLSALFTDVLGRTRILCGLSELQPDRQNVNAQGAEDGVSPLAPERAEERQEQQLQRHRSRKLWNGIGSGSGGGGGGSSGSDSDSDISRISFGDSSSSQREGSGRVHRSADREKENDISTKGSRVDFQVDDRLCILSATKSFEELVGARPNYDCKPSLAMVLGEIEVFALWVKRFSEDTRSDGPQASCEREVSIPLKRFFGNGQTFKEYLALCRVKLVKVPDAQDRVTLWFLKIRGPRGAGAEWPGPEWPRMEPEGGPLAAPQAVRPGGSGEVVAM